MIALESDDIENAKDNINSCVSKATILLCLVPVYMGW